jgi:hypothetical protein
MATFELDSTAVRTDVTVAPYRLQTEKGSVTVWIADLGMVKQILYEMPSPEILAIIMEATGNISAIVEHDIEQHFMQNVVKKANDKPA